MSYYTRESQRTAFLVSTLWFAASAIPIYWALQVLYGLLGYATVPVAFLLVALAVAVSFGQGMRRLEPTEEQRERAEAFGRDA